ncbi:MAG TPA: ABC transporter permease [Vicinamibacterales bacterium]|jgi:ABC-2 type transport system permease protein|nr:ABC transporter permease [Vicinamibacterales bacterium]
MRFSRTLALLERQWYLLRGSPTRVVPLFGFVVIDIVLWGFITRYLDMTAGGVDFVTSLLGAVVFWDYCVRVLHGVTMTFFEDVWSRNFLNIFASPLTLVEYLGGQVLSSLFTSAIGLLAMVVIATLLFGWSIGAYGLMAVPFVLVLFLFGVAMGVVGAAIILRFGPAAEWFVWPIPALIAPFGGVYYPVSTLPGWMHPIARALPVSYVFEGLRAIAAGQAFAPGSLAMGAGLAALYVVAACWTFARVYQHAVRTGLIARYSAETIT